MSAIDEAIRTLRNDPRYAQLIHDSYLSADVTESAERFHRSTEFAEVHGLIGRHIQGGRILDLGAGRGISSYAFGRSGAQIVYALEPDPSDEVGYGAIRRLQPGLPIQIIEALGENIPLRDGQLDVVYARQVLHHTRDLARVLGECARVLKSGGVLLVCREHVVDDEHQLADFLSNHPVHQLVGGENAYSLDQYLQAILAAGLRLQRLLGPWDSIINAFPAVRSPDALRRYPRTRLERKLGKLGAVMSFLPGVNALIWRRLNRPVPGRLYSFLAVKP